MVEKIVNYKSTEDDLHNKYENEGGCSEQVLLPKQHAFFEKNAYLNNCGESVLLAAPKNLNLSSLFMIVHKIFMRHDILRFRLKLKNEKHFSYYEDFNEKIFSQSIEHKLFYGHHFNGLTKYLSEFKSNLSLFEGPVFKVVFCQLIDKSFCFPGDSRLFLIMHRLVVDGFSWRILIDELNFMLSNIENIKPFLLEPKVTSYQMWARFLIKYSNDINFSLEYNYWKKLVSEIMPDLSDGFKASKPRRHLISKFKIQLSIDDTSKLLNNANKIYHVNVIELLLASLLVAFNRWKNVKELRIDFEENDRGKLPNHFDFSRTIGFLSYIYPMILKSESMDITSVIHTVKKLYRGVPGNGFGFEALAFIKKDCEILKQYNENSPQVIFSYFGDSDGFSENNKYFYLDPEPTSVDFFSKKNRNYPIDFISLVANGKLVFDIGYDEKIFDHDSIASLSNCMQSVLQEVVLLREETINNQWLPLFNSQNLEIRRHNSRYVLGSIFEFDNDVNFTALDIAVNSAFSHFDTLRIKFKLIGEKWVQIVQDESYLDNPCIKIESDFVSKEDFWFCIKKLWNDITSELNIQQDVLFKVICVDGGSKQNDVVIVFVHHLVSDGFSFRLLVDYIFSHYFNVINGVDQYEVKNVCSLYDYAKWVISIPFSSDIRFKLSQWLSVDSWEKDSLVARKNLIGENYKLNREYYKIRNMDSVSIKIKKRDTKSFVKYLYSAHGIDIENGFPLLILYALSKKFGTFALPFWVIEHGRNSNDDINLSNMVAFLALHVICRLDLNSSLSVGNWIEESKSELKKFKDNAYSFSAAYFDCDFSSPFLSSNELNKIKSIDYPEIVFNYFGVDNRDEKLNNINVHNVDVKDITSEKDTDVFSLSLSYGIVDEQLFLKVNYNEKLYKRGDILLVLDIVSDLVESVIVKNHGK